MQYEYMDSGIEWIGTIPKHWKTRRIKDVSDYVQTGKTPPSSKGDFFTDGSIDWFTPADLDNEPIVYSSKRKIIPKSIEKKLVPYFKANTILFVGIGATVGKISKIVNNASCNQQINAILFSAKMYHQYGLYYMLITGTEIKKFASFVTLPIFTQTDTKQLQIIVPTIKEQKVIANYLDNACENIEKTIKSKEQQIIKINDYYYSIIHEIVTKGLNKSTKLKSTNIECIGDIPIHWDMKRLFNICSFVRGNSTFGKNELLDEGKYVALQYGKTYKVEEINEQFNFYVNDEFYKSSQVVNHGDTIFVSTSETMEDLGHSVFYNRKDIGLIGGEQILLKPNKNILDGKYLFYSSKVFGQGLKKFATGIKVFRFDVYDLKTIYTPLPPLEEQLKIADYLEKTADKVNKIKEKLQAQIDTLKEYRKSLIHECVTGKKQIYKGSEGE